jgi:hypothetical protein
VSLIEAGAAVDVINEWKLSPLAVAYLKGHLETSHSIFESI